MNEYGGIHAYGDEYDGDIAGGEDDDELYLLSQVGPIVGNGEALLQHRQQQQQHPHAVNLDDPEIAALPRILLMGPRRGGKSSIERVVFQKMSPHETLFRLEATNSLETTLVDHTSLCRCTIQDFPGDYYGEDLDESLVFNAGVATSLIFVVDAQDEPYDHVLQSFTSVMTRALQVNPHITVEVFINKVDGELFLSEESKYDCRRDIMTQVTDELSDAGIPDGSVAIRYHLTSIYDHTIYEALSRVVQRLIPQLPTLENLLNVLTATCSMEKAYLFDVVSKLYISTDSGPVDMQSVELCSDMIDVVLDVSGIYGLPKETGQQQQQNQNDLLEAVAEHQQSFASNGELENELLGNDVIDNPSAYDEESASVIRLSNGMVLYLKEVDTMLALVCITRAENFTRRSLIDYNISCLKQALKAIVKVKEEIVLALATANANNATATTNKNNGGLPPQQLVAVAD